MTNCAILRTAKLKSMGNIAASLSHTYRSRETPNANVQLTSFNEHSHEGPKDVLKNIEARLPAKRRKDAVLAIEYFIGASPAWFRDRKSDEPGYFKDALTWLEQRHGKENVVAWSIHRDETSPHLVAYVLPLNAGKLNAKKWLGGRATLSQMQTDFAETVGAAHGLERGIEGSTATHQTVKDWYAQVERPVEHVTIQPENVEQRLVQRGIFSNEYEDPAVVAERVTRQVRQAYEPVVQKAKTAASEGRRAEEMARTARTKDQDLKKAQSELKRLVEMLRPFIELAVLAKSVFQELHELAAEKVEALKLEKAQKRSRGRSR